MILNCLGSEILEKCNLISFVWLFYRAIISYQMDVFVYTIFNESRITLAYNFNLCQRVNYITENLFAYSEKGHPDCGSCGCP